MTASRVQNRFYSEWDMETFQAPRVLKDGDPRTVFEMDRDRICYSGAFRRLQSKTQVFQSGEYDFYRTRLTHSIEVAHVGRSIAAYLNRTSPLLSSDFYIDEALVEGICLAHDLGHPPFGHIGERRLNELMAPWGGFEGNAQTLRILTERIYYQGNGQVCGMRPSRGFLDGILKYKQLHCAFKQTNSCAPSNHFLYDDQGDCLKFVEVGPEQSLECQLMDWADDAAYCLHDIIDGVRAGFISEDTLRGWMRDSSADFLKNYPDCDVGELLAPLIESIRADNIELYLSRKIGIFIHSVTLKKALQPAATSNRYGFDLSIDPLAQRECELYKRIALNLIFESPALQRYEFKGGMILGALFDAICEHYVQRDHGLKILPIAVASALVPEKNVLKKMRLICDYLAELTDRQAIQAYKRLYHPDFGSITDLA